ncbi:MAG: nuclear transport factor 2 family protein [Pseudomonadota bacterium]
MRASIAIAAIASVLAAPTALAQASPQTVVQRNVDAYRAGDLDRFVATFAHDATVDFNGVQVTGQAQIHNIYRSNFAEGAPEIRIEESSMDGNRIFLKVAYVFADGSEACCSFSEYTIVQGKIVYLRAEGFVEPQ